MTLFFPMAAVKLQGSWSSMSKNWKDASQTRSGFLFFYISFGRLIANLSINLGFEMTWA